MRSLFSLETRGLRLRVRLGPVSRSDSGRGKDTKLRIQAGVQLYRVSAPSLGPEPVGIKVGNSAAEGAKSEGEESGGQGQRRFYNPSAGAIVCKAIGRGKEGKRKGERSDPIAAI